MRTIDGDDDSYDEINKRLSKSWYNADDECHRDGDLPAMILPNGSIFYCRNGRLHRDSDLPAVIYADGTVEYWVNGGRSKNDNNRR